MLEMPFFGINGGSEALFDPTWNDDECLVQVVSIFPSKSITCGVSMSEFDESIP